MTLGDFRTQTASLPDSTPLIVAQFTTDPHPDPQYWGLLINTVAVQNMVEIGSWWQNPLDPTYRGGTTLPQVQSVFMNPTFPPSNPKASVEQEFVYVIITRTDYEDYEVDGVYLTDAEAEAVACKCPGSYVNKAPLIRSK